MGKPVLFSLLIYSCYFQLEYLEVGTPVSNSFYLGGPKGEAYGLNLDRTRFTLDSCLNLRPETGIPGLYLTGNNLGY